MTLQSPKKHLITNKMTEKILILDFGSQYTQLIARKIRECGVYCEIHPFNRIPSIDSSVRGVVLSGSPASVLDADAPQPDLNEIRGRLPLLGVCIVMMAVILIICSTLIAVSGIESKTVKLRQVMLEQDIMAKDIAIDFVKGKLYKTITDDAGNTQEVPVFDYTYKNGLFTGTYKGHSVTLSRTEITVTETPESENPIKSWTETITISRQNGETEVSVKVTEKDGNKTRIVTSWTNGSVI